jgi:NTP pyrophosphatase (non-canonical NTP hydrolase)
MNPDKITEDITVKELQEYIRQMTAHRGFDSESIGNKLILFVEEVGELAKAIRKEAGMKFSETTQRTELEEELADVQIVLLDIANKLGIDMRTAVAAKETKNHERVWK